MARQIGAGHPEAAIRQGIGGLWLAGLIGALVLAAGWPLAGTGVLRDCRAPGARTPRYGATVFR